MKLFGLVWANLFRKKTRTLLTLLSLISAFLLFGIMQTFTNAFNANANFVGTTRIVSQAKVSFTYSLPMRMLPELESMPGVAAVSYAQWFGGVYQDKRNFFPQFAVDPDRLFAVYPEWTLTDAEKLRFKSVKASAIVGQQLAKRFGWKVGQQIPLTSTIWSKEDGSKDWTFEVAGIFGGIDENWTGRASLMYLNFGYFDDAREFGRGGAGTFGIRLEDPNQAEALAQQIDARYANSPDETKTQAEKDFNIGFVRQIADFGLIAGYVLGAVFFTILTVAGNTMSQSVRERIPELAILKTLGFKNESILSMVMIEAALLCVLGALLGMSLAAILITGASKVMPLQISLAPASLTLWLYALLVALILSVAVSIIPAWRASSLKIVDALAGR